MPTTNPLVRLRAFGQSIWLDLLSRNLIRSGKLAELIRSDGVSGITSNPTIFDKAIGQSSDYDADIHSLTEAGKTAPEICRDLTIGDIREAADILRPTYTKTDGEDGYVSLEVSPLLARDTRATVHEANELWRAVNRPNVMIKIPATREGLRAITESIAAGINVNITLLFGLPRYREVAEAYIRGIEHRIADGQDVHRIRSVASFFLSRIDVLVDSKLPPAARNLRGSAAIASAKLAYEIYKEVFGSERFRKLQERGARKQWLLWASTGAKSKESSDIKYVEPLIGRETVSTLPMETLEAYRDHGSPEPRLDQGADSARETMAALSSAGIEIDTITNQLEDEGIKKFVHAFEELMESIEKKTRSFQRV
ncbi:MAG TPA: transaldolase [Bryobacteraceae bacterium]|nr:transaldolase [Bryobacteraceae bacterium]